MTTPAPDPVSVPALIEEIIADIRAEHGRILPPRILHLGAIGQEVARLTAENEQLRADRDMQSTSEANLLVQTMNAERALAAERARAQTLTAENEQLRAQGEAVAAAWRDDAATLQALLLAERARVQAVRDLCNHNYAKTVSRADVLAAIGDGDDRG